MIKKIEFSARNLTSNAGILLLLEHASKNGIFDLIDHDLVFENPSTNKIKMNQSRSVSSAHHCTRRRSLPQECNLVGMRA